MKTTKHETNNSRVVKKFVRRARAVFALAAAVAWPASAQLTLTGTNYTQDFNSIGNGLPAGWSVKTNATTTSLGSGPAFPMAAKSWADTGGEFGNCASLTNNSGVPATGSESAATQAAFTNRVLAVRQTGSFGDPGAAFVLQINNTLGFSNLTFSVDLNLLRSNPNSTTWTLDYAVGNSPAAFTTLGTYTDPGVIGSTTTNFSLGPDANNQSENVWIRIAALNVTTNGGTRDTFGIDNFGLTYAGPSAPSVTIQPVSRTNAVLTTATFSVAAAGAPPLFYQWYKGDDLLTDGDNVSGATSDTLTLSQLFHTNAGNYKVIVTNTAAPASPTTSSVAALTVVGFAIAPLPPTNVIAGTPVSVSLDFIDNQSPVTAAAGRSSNQSILPDGNISASAAGNSGSATVTPLTGGSGVVLVSLTASEGSFSTNTVFPLLVVPSGEVLFSDHFDYANGAVISASTGLWRNHSGPAGEVIVTNGELRVLRSLDEDVCALLVGHPYPTNSTTVLYSRFRVRFTDLPASGGNYFAHFMNISGSGHRGRVWASTANAAPGKFRLGIGNAGTSTATTAQFPLDLESAANYIIVTRLVVSNGLSTLWINPVSETDTSVTAGDAVTNLVDITSYAFRQDGSEGNLLVDDLVVGTSFAAVVGGNSPPSVPLNISVQGNDVVLSWSNPTFTLASATNASGPYAKITGASSPCTNRPTEEAKFFRLIWP